MKLHYGSIKSYVYWPVKVITRIVFFSVFRVLCNGLENLPKDSPFILLVKHQRWEDIPLMGIVLPRPLYYIAKHELFKNPVTGWLLSSLGGIPLNRSRPMESRSSILDVMDSLRDGEGVVIFPEGTYYPGHMGRGKTGLLRMIQSRLSIPFIPAGIQYKRYGIRTQVKIDIGEPVFEKPDEIINRFSELIMEKIAGLSGMSYDY